MSINVYQMVTDRIIAELEKGNIPWEKPWTGVQSGAISGTTGKAYSLINQMILGKSGKWFTWNQIQAKGWKIRKGERASFVVFWKNQIIKETDKQRVFGTAPLTFSPGSEFLGMTAGLLSAPPVEQKKR